MEYDVFICHASDDKDGFVRPLAAELSQHGLRVWFDEFVLRPGDSLRESIDRGLSAARRCVVVLSPRFFGRGWPEWELNGIVQRHLASDRSILLPVWLDVSSEDVRKASPPLADLVAVRAAGDVTKVARKIASLIGPSGTKEVFEAQSLASRAVELIVETVRGVVSGSVRGVLRIRENQDLVAVAASGVDDIGTIPTLSIASSVTGLTFRKGEPVIVEDIVGDVSNVGIYKATIPQMRAMIGVPLRDVTGEVYGVVSVTSTVPNAFGDVGQMDLILKTIRVCAIAVERLLPLLRRSPSA